MESARGSITIAARPERIVSLSPTATETLFALGADADVVAVDDQSDYPDSAPRSDLQYFSPNVEAIAAFEPDLVLVATDSGSEVVERLGALGVPVLQQTPPATVDAAYAQIEQIGRATGRSAEADELVAGMRSDIAGVVAEVGEAGRGLSYFHELDDTLYSVTSESFIGSLYALLGLSNIADAAGGSSEYPQLSAEYIIARNPVFVFLADVECCSQSSSTFASRPGFGELDAVREGRVIELDGDVASRWGPRLVEFLEAVGDAILARGIE